MNIFCIECSMYEIKDQIKFDNITLWIPSTILNKVFLFFRNGVSVEGATHKQVVDLIKSGGDCLTLTVISVTQQVSSTQNYTYFSFDLV